MNTGLTIHKTLTCLIALVWLVNGLFCKVLNFVPRHQLIVAKITASEYAGLLTKAIGLAEIVMVLWIVSNVKLRLCALAQIVVVTLMNSIEFALAPELLLFGKWNAFLAFVLIAVVFCNEFLLRKQSSPQAY